MLVRPSFRFLTGIWPWRFFFFKFFSLLVTFLIFILSNCFNYTFIFCFACNYEKEWHFDFSWVAIVFVTSHYRMEAVVTIAMEKQMRKVTMKIVERQLCFLVLHASDPRRISKILVNPEDPNKKKFFFFFFFWLLLCLMLVVKELVWTI